MNIRSIHHGGQPVAKDHEGPPVSRSTYDAIGSDWAHASEPALSGQFQCCSQTSDTSSERLAQRPASTGPHSPVRLRTRSVSNSATVAKKLSSSRPIGSSG